MGRVSTHTRWRGRRREIERGGGIERSVNKGGWGWRAWTCVSLVTSFSISKFTNNKGRYLSSQLRFGVCVPQNENTWMKAGELYAALMLFSYAAAPQGQREVCCEPSKIPNTHTQAHAQTSTHSSFLYPPLFLKCGQIRDHRLFMPLTKPATWMQFHTRTH